MLVPGAFAVVLVLLDLYPVAPATGVVAITVPKVAKVAPHCEGLICITPVAAMFGEFTVQVAP